MPEKPKRLPDDQVREALECIEQLLREPCVNIPEAEPTAQYAEAEWFHQHRIRAAVLILGWVVVIGLITWIRVDDYRRSSLRHDGKAPDQNVTLTVGRRE